MRKTAIISLFCLSIFVTIIFVLFWQKDAVVTHTDPLSYGFYAQSVIKSIQTDPSTALDVLYLHRNIRGTFHEPLFLLFYWPLQDFYRALFAFGLCIALLFVSCLYSLFSQRMKAKWAFLSTLFVFFTPNLLMEFFYADTFIVSGTFLLLANCGLLKRNSLEQLIALAAAFCIRPVESFLVCAILYFFDKRNRDLLKIQIAGLVLGCLWWLPILSRYTQHIYSQLNGTLTFTSEIESASVMHTFLDNIHYYLHIGGVVFLFLSVLALYRSARQTKWLFVFSFLLIQFFTIGNPQYILFTFFSCLIGLLYEAPSLWQRREKYFIFLFALFQIMNGVVCSVLKWDAPWGGLITPATRNEETIRFFTLIQNKLPKDEDIPIIGLCKKDHKSLHYFSTMLISEQVIRKEYSYRLQPLPLESLEGGFIGSAPYTIVVMHNSLSDPSLESEAAITIPETKLNRWANKFFRIPELRVTLVKDLQALQVQFEKCKAIQRN